MKKVWKNLVSPPPKENICRIGHADGSWDDMVSLGDEIFEILNTQMISHTSTKNKKILDFGCGCGRVLFPFHFRTNSTIYGSDIDHTAISYLKAFIESNRLVVNKFEPPTSFPDKFFDIIYSISIWTHIDSVRSVMWLGEMSRILKSGGYCFITTAGLGALKQRRRESEKHWLRKWQNIDSQILEDEGYLFMNYDGLRNNPDFYVGVDGDYGLSAIHPNYIRNNWTDYFEVKSIIESYVGYQDLVILKKR